MAAKNSQQDAAGWQCVLDLYGCRAPGIDSLDWIREQMLEAARRRLRPGEVRQGKIVALRAEGIYLDLGDILGLIPVEIAVQGYITHPADLYYRGQEMSVRIDYVTAEFMPVVSPFCS